MDSEFDHLLNSVTTNFRSLIDLFPVFAGHPKATAATATATQNHLSATFADDLHRRLGERSHHSATARVVQTNSPNHAAGYAVAIRPSDPGVAAGRPEAADHSAVGRRPTATAASEFHLR